MNRPKVFFRLVNSFPMILLFFCGHMAFAASSSVTVGAKFPAIKLMKLSDGKKSDLVEQGQMTMINLWATWCDACKVEIAEMESVLLPISKKSDSKVRLAFVSLDKEPEKARKWFQENTKSTSIMLDKLYSDANFELADQLDADSFPMTVIVDSKGTVIHVEKGFKDGAEGVEQVRKIAGILGQNQL